MTYFCPALDPPLGGSGRKTTTLVRDLEYFIHTKFHQNPSSGSGEEVENVNCLTDRRQTTDAGQHVITIGHWSLRLLCPKNGSGPQLLIALLKPNNDISHICWPQFNDMSGHWKKVLSVSLGSSHKICASVTVAFILHLSTMHCSIQ